jgi:lysophospholipase L1-like esterase
MFLYQQGRFATLVLALLVLVGLLAGCDSGVPQPASTPTSANSSTTAEPTAVAQVTDVVPTEEATPEPAAETPTEEPTPEPEATAEPTDEVISEPTPEEAPTQASTPVARPTSGVRATPRSVPAGPLTIVAMGDSLTEGDADDPGRGGYPARLESMVNRVRPGSRVINLGKSGWDTTQMLEGQMPATLEANPQVVLVWIGSNNLFNNSGPGEGEAVDRARYESDIDTTLSTLTGAGARVYLALMDDHGKRPYVTSPNGAGLDQEGAAYMDRLSRSFNEVLRAKAAEYGATLIDFHSTTIFSDSATMADDGIHPNANGYDIIAQMWFDALSPALQSR